MPIYKQASYSGETIELCNEHIRLQVHKRITGWGWGELFDGTGRYIGVLEHFGELMIRDQEMPVRLESNAYERKSSAEGESLVFPVKAMVVQEKLNGTSFAQWIHYPFGEPLLEGLVKLTLAPNEAVIKLSFKLKSKANLFARYVRGPWFKAGAGGTGIEKDDAIFPGVEWLVKDEWSSGTDWFKDPWAMRSVPHPNKVAIPLMTVSAQGIAVGLGWDANQDATRWFNYRAHRPQPVFASPNFIDRKNDHLLGLMVPSVEAESDENKVYADSPLELHPEQRIEWDAELFVVKGSSLDAVADWTKRHGLPDPGVPRWSVEEAIQRIARAYNERFWHDGEGFGTLQHERSIHPHAPRFLGKYMELFGNSPLGKELSAKIDWCREENRRRVEQSAQHGEVEQPMKDSRLKYGTELLAHQHSDGSLPFDPDGRHYMKDDFVVAREFLEPMGHAGASALDLCVVPASAWISCWEASGDDTFRTAAIKALDYCLPMQRPEGGDFWETPLHSPNLLAAGHAAVAYWRGYQAFGNERYKERAVYWLRSLLPFTHLWEPSSVPMLYNTKPCFCSSDWYFANWVRDHVQWEVLETFALSSAHHIEWAKIDPEIDWDRYHRGITYASLRWMIDHSNNKWRPHNLPATLEQYALGQLDDCFADTHNAVTGNYGGMGIMPDVIAVNLLELYERDKAKLSG